MSAVNPWDNAALANQIQRQLRHAWDLEKDLPWADGIDFQRPFLPLDADAIAFPGTNPEQRLALSQFLGLVINSTISEMESVIHRLKDSAWQRTIEQYPVNPEMKKLGELFFSEENKHSAMFDRYNQIFCDTHGIPIEQMARLLPKAFGSRFLGMTQKNANDGGMAFWWVVATVEEVSIQLYRDLDRHREAVDPLYYWLHRRHLEEESRHRNYAFLMLELYRQAQPTGLRALLHRKLDLVLAQIFSAGWVLSELSKIFESEKMKDDHPFFATLASCLPLFRNLSPLEVVTKLFVTAPYVSTVLNTRYHKRTLEEAINQGAWSLPFPAPKTSETSVA